MSDDEINKYIHERIMGKCWHEQGVGSKCSKCPETLYIAPRSPSRFDPGSWVQNPDYCSDASPRSLLNAVVDVIYAQNDEISDKMTIALVGCDTRGLALACYKDHQEAQ